MPETLVSLIPLIIGAAIVPLLVIAAIVLLTSEKHGPLKAIAFVIGMTLVRLAQGALFGFVFNGGGAADGAEQAGIVKDALLIVLGLLLLLAGVKKLLKQPDPDAPPPKWLTALESVPAWGALALGAGLLLVSAKAWVFTLSAISTIDAAQLGRRDSVITFLLFVLLAQSLIIIPIIIRLLLPSRATAWLGFLNAWLEAHNNQIALAVSFVFGALFLYQGIAGLLA